ncbi:MAG: Gfo/Idh/MocA family oxidoreductase [Anaerolineae bacterium]|nr:Gfo/Idh/MocA family oxidoreductase [Anaerolineae bacterium]
MLKVGMIGMGMMGWLHARRYYEIDGASLVAIADVTPSRLEATEAVVGNLASSGKEVDLAGLARYGDGSELIASADVDMIDICLPSYLHARYAIEALQAGRHVLCEKPMALSVADADRMIDAAERSGQQLMIAQCIRFWPEYLYLQRCVEEETFGKLLSLNMSRMGGRPIWSWENWFTDPARSGGPPYDLHIHDVDFCNAMLGMPDQVQAVGRRSEATGGYDVIHALYEYADGPQVHIHAGWSNAQIPFAAAFDAWFERGFLRYSGHQDPPLQIYDDLRQVAARPAEVEPGDAYKAEIAYFVDCVERGTPPVQCPPASARDSLRLIDLEIEALESGRTLRGKE